MDNLEKSKTLLQKADKIIPHAEVIIVANKQDLPNAMHPDDITQKIGYKVYPYTANSLKSIKELLVQVGKLLEIDNPELDYSKDNFMIERN